MPAGGTRHSLGAQPGHWKDPRVGHGRDRTGLVVGCYRMWINGWSDSVAAREMSALGYRWSLPGLSAFWKSVTPVKNEDENK